MNEKHIQKQLYSQHKQALSEQLEFFKNQKNEMQEVFEYINELEKANIGDEILAPLSGGIFVKAKLKDNKLFKVNIGSSIMVDKTSTEVKEIIKNQIKNIEEAEKNIEDNLDNIDKELKKLN